jgi:hypothetical protein
LENLGWKVVSLLSAQRTLRGIPRIRHGAYRSRDVLTALLAADREDTVPSLRKVEHECQYRGTKGETAMWISPELNPGRSLRCVEANLISIISVVYGEVC